MIYQDVKGNIKILDVILCIMGSGSIGKTVILLKKGI